MPRPSHTIHAFRLLPVSFALTATLLGAQARAQRDEGVNAGIAEQLFQDAQRLMAQGKYTQACPKLAESQRLDPGIGTLFHLAECHQGEGKTATAWAEFSTVRAKAEQAGRRDQMTLADERVTALTPRLCHLTINVSEAAKVEGLEIKLDGSLITNAAWGTPAVVDPGVHVVKASAPGKADWSQSSKELKGDGDRDSIDVPVLQMSTGVETGAAPATSSSEPIIDSGNSRPVPASVYVAGGATVALALGAGVTGALYMSKKSAYEKKNDDPAIPNSAVKSAQSSMKTMGAVNLALSGGAVAAAATTAILYFTRPTRSTSATTVAPWFTAEAAGISASGSF